MKLVWRGWGGFWSLLRGFIQNLYVTLACQFTCYQWGLSLRKVLRGWNVIPGDDVLVWSGCGRQLFVLHLCLGHIVISWVKILLLETKKALKFYQIIKRGTSNNKKSNFKKLWINAFKNMLFSVVEIVLTPFCILFIRKSEPPGFWPKPGYFAFNLASSVRTGFEFVSWDSWKKYCDV